VQQCCSLSLVCSLSILCDWYIFLLLHFNSILDEPRLAYSLSVSGFLSPFIWNELLGISNANYLSTGYPFHRTSTVKQLKGTQSSE